MVSAMGADELAFRTRVGIGELLPGQQLILVGISRQASKRLPQSVIPGIRIDPDARQKRRRPDGHKDHGSRHSHRLPPFIHQSQGAGADEYEVCDLASDEIHFELTPGLPKYEKSPRRLWGINVQDDTRTEYGDHHVIQLFNDSVDDNLLTVAIQGLGSRIPQAAGRLHLSFQPALGWIPRSPWIRDIEFALV